MSRWHHHAACAGWPTDLWFPTKGSTVDPAVLRICRQCPVQAECLDAAIREEGAIRYGVRGGLNPNQRDTYARREAA